MNISRNSWHYRLVDFAVGFFGQSPSNSICLYFWQVVFVAPVIIICVVAIVTFGVAIVAFGICSLLVFFLYGVGVIVNDMSASVHILPLSFRYLPGIFNYRAVISSVLIDAALVGCFVYKVHRQRNPKAETKESEQNFVIAFLKAKKEKICPFINFKD